MINIDQHRILHALDSELEVQDRALHYRITRCEQQGRLWALNVDSVAGSPPVSERLEGAVAWWPGSPNGQAEVVVVHPEEDRIVLRFASQPLPSSGTLHIYPVKFLESLRELWENDATARNAQRWLNSFTASDRPHATPLDSSSWSGLRQGQRRAFELTRWQRAFLWGPPGTGKTYTLGRFAAQYLLQHPRSRILLLSTTNPAVDEALAAVDDALSVARDAGKANEHSLDWCVRIGSRFIASKYAKRRHLLADPDENDVMALVQLEAQRPEKSDTAAYVAWFEACETIRARLRRRTTELVEASRLAAMTTTLAAFQFDQVSSFAPFDLIVFDEASQVGLASAFALAPLGKQSVFAGDPRQLSPIVQSTKPEALEWLGRSSFELMDSQHASTCMLDEQSRMAPDICKVVSGAFYKGALRVAEDALRDPSWRKARHPPPLTNPPREVVLQPVGTEAHSFSPRYNGPIRMESAVATAVLVRAVLRTISVGDLLVVTPFHSQRAMIREQLARIDVRGVTISTVHRAQGSERHTVIFDPVQANSDFFRRTLDANRLVNVALSRAKACVVLLLSAEDRLCGAIADVLKHAMVEKPRSAQEYAHMDGFPKNMLGQLVMLANGVLVRITGFESREQVILGRSLSDDSVHRLSTKTLRDLAGQ